MACIAVEKSWEKKKKKQSIPLIYVVHWHLYDPWRYVNFIPILIQNFQEYLEDATAKRLQIPLGKFFVLFCDVSWASIPDDEKIYLILHI